MIKKIIVVFTLFVSVAGFSQVNNTSVYSFFGIGDKNNALTTENMNMGGVGVSFADVHHINFANPAANASLNFTNYTLGLVNKNLVAKQDGSKENAAATYISYLAMGFDIGKNGGLSFGLLPHTSVGYNVLSNVYNDDEEVVQATYYKGEGGTNKVFLGFGYTIFKGFSIGIQGNYIFGKIENSITDQVRDVALSTKYETVSNISGFNVDAGFQYKAKLSEKINLHLGANFNFKDEVTSKEKEYLYSIDLGIGTVGKDTILNNSNKGTLKNPLKSTMGLGFGKENKWFAGIDYSFQKASELTGSIYNSDLVKYNDYSKFAVGGFYIPKFNSVLSYWNRVTYRAGFNMEESGLMVDSEGDGSNFESIDSFGITFGVGLPVGKQVSNLNLGFEYGQRGKTNSNLVREDYFNFRMSISLNDKWFKKKQIF